MKTKSLASELARAAIDSMALAGLDQDELLHGPVKLTDLPWQVPPLHVEAPLCGVPLYQYFERPTYVSADHLLNLWSDALLNLRNKPGSVLTAEGLYRAASYVLPKLTTQERCLRLTVPEGFPGGVSELSGAMLSLEAAHMCRYGTRLTDFVSDDSNYYAVLPSGQEIGVKDGVPALWGEQWDMSVEGMVQEMLGSGRGNPAEVCHYDIIDKVRSALGQHKFPEAEAIEWALQTLRILNEQTSLIRAIKGMKQRAKEKLNRLATVEQAYEVAFRFAISDRSRIVTMRSLLVPEVLTPSEFSTKFYPYSSTPPPTVHEKVINRIRTSMQLMMDEERAKNSE